jgi:hypothetical protein
MERLIYGHIRGLVYHKAAVCTYAQKYEYKIEPATGFGKMSCVSEFYHHDDYPDACGF